MSERLSYAIAVLFLLLAATLRIWEFTSVPAGLSDLEISHVNLMRDEIMRGDIRVFYEREGAGQEGIYHMMLALSTLVFGTGTLGFRIISLMANLGAIALMYSVGVRLYGRVAGLAAMGLLTVMMWHNLLSRLIVVEALLPVLITAVLLTLARAMPVYSRARAESTNTQDFAILGVLLGLSLYVHPSGLMLVLMAMAFITYIIITRRPLSLRWLSYIGFTILMMVIVAMPYLISTIRLSELDAGERIFGNYGSITFSLIDSVVGLMVRGDALPLYNLPERPLIDLVSAFFVIIGGIIALRGWRQPRFGLLVLASVFLAPIPLLADNSPNFLAFSTVIPVIALLFGLGLSQVLANLPKTTRIIGIVAALGLLAFNVYWTSQDLFTNWQDTDDVQIAYNAEIGEIARYLDATADEIPTILCYPNWDVPHQPDTPLTPAEELLLLLNNDSANIRYVDCRSGFLFINLGAKQQVVIPSAEIYEQIPPGIADWLSLGTPVAELSERSVIIMDVQDMLLESMGVYQTTTPASYETETETVERQPIPPPIRFAGNITWLGYETDPYPFYSPRSVVPVTTYWRVEGNVPRDLIFFTHILSDPVTLVANRDTMAVNPAQLEERDIFIHMANVPLEATVLSGVYEISIGAYRWQEDDRLEVIDDDGVMRGDRIFLYGIEVQQ